MSRDRPSNPPRPEPKTDQRDGKGGWQKPVAPPPTDRVKPTGLPKPPKK